MWQRIMGFNTNQAEDRRFMRYCLLNVLILLCRKIEPHFIDAMVFVCIHSYSAQAYRDNGRIAIDSQELAQALWMNAGIRDIMNSVKFEGKEALGLNSNIRFYRYGKGQRFGRHVDDSVEVSPNGVTKYTLLIYLSDVVGGETVFYNHRGRKVVAVCPKPGRVLLHRHGNECLEHEALPVVEGTKYVLRSDVIFPS